MSEFIASTQTERIARKEHKCDECEGTIRVGEKYLYARATGRVDGEFMWTEFKYHPACLEKYEYTEEMEVTANEVIEALEAMGAVRG